MARIENFMADRPTDALRPGIDLLSRLSPLSLDQVSAYAASRNYIE